MTAVKPFAFLHWP